MSTYAVALSGNKLQFAYLYTWSILLYVEQEGAREYVAGWRDGGMKKKRCYMRMERAGAVYLTL